MIGMDVDEYNLDTHFHGTLTRNAIGWLTLAEQ